MFRTVLVANRGEIARRVLTTARRMGLRTVAVYSDADRHGPYLRLADRLAAIGGNTPAESYLRIDAILEAARRSGVEAIHPGYGFLSENPELARRCADEGIVFVGPPAPVLERLGNKVSARRLAQEIGVPVVPGISQPVTPLEVRAFVREQGLPVVLKAAAGGGGRGMRVIRSADEIEAACPAAAREAQAAFGDPSVFVERYFTEVRHVEVQILADAHGACVHLGERECSIQRRHQKLLEESPCAALDEGLRHELCAAAVRLARAAGYVNAGTCEFLVTPQGLFYFLEVNARIQVEHPVTEMRVGRDLVADQLRIAAGQPLGFAQEDVRPRGHAIEARICAEDPFRRFLPAVGTVRHVRWPEGEGVRIDTDLEPGCDVLPFYDSLVAKLIVWGPEREAALDRLGRALADLEIEGLPTTAPLFRRLVEDPDFRAGRTYTRFLPEHLDVLSWTPEELRAAAAIAARLEAHRRTRLEAALADGRQFEPWRKW